MQIFACFDTRHFSLDCKKADLHERLLIKMTSFTLTKYVPVCRLSAAISQQGRFFIESLYKQHALYSRREQSRTHVGFMEPFVAFYGLHCCIRSHSSKSRIVVGGWLLLFHWHLAPDPSLLELLDEGAEDGAVAEVLLDGRLLPSLANALALRIDLVQVHVHPVREGVGLKKAQAILIGYRRR